MAGWLLGFPDMMQLGFPQGTLLMAFQQKARRPVSPGIAFGVGSAPHSHRCFWAPFYLSPDEMEERNSASEV